MSVSHFFYNIVGMGVFNINSGFSKFVNRALDVIWLNFLWMIFCIPIITAGAATCAAFSVSLKMVDDEEGYVGRMFLKAFKDNFKQGTLMWCITLPWLILVVLAWWVVTWAEDYYFIILFGTIIFTALFIALNVYTYPLIARYENTLKNMMKNSLGICLTYFGRTILICFLIALEVFLILWNRWTLLAGLIIGPEFIIFTVSALAKRVFQKIERHEEENSGTINQ